MKRALCTLTALLLATGPALAQRAVPGLWEYSTSMKGDARMDAAMVRMKEEMARMTPEQRKAMEGMMAQRGVAMAPGGAGGGMTIKVCLTPEQVSRDELHQQAEGNCKQTSRERSGNTLRFKFECTGERQTKGEGEYTFVSDKEHKGRTVVTSLVKGQPQRMEVETAAKWLGADCGDVKPRASKP